ncbi:19061_t:CDS:2 [Entrophospora sp. SA101]|nr:19061_t:CDS:2 [Entrophospora sp. SA101]
MIQEKHHAENPIKVTFKDAKCVKCGKETDIRLAEKYPCHTKEINHKHPSTEIVHTGYVTTQNEYRKFGDRTLGLMVALSAVLTVVKTWQIRQNAWGITKYIIDINEDKIKVLDILNPNNMQVDFNPKQIDIIVDYINDGLRNEKDISEDLKNTIKHLRIFNELNNNLLNTSIISSSNNNNNTINYLLPDEEEKKPMPIITRSDIRIIAVGKTGLGKSFTATVFGFNAEVGNDPDSMTKNVTIYSSDNINAVKRAVNIINVGRDMLAKTSFIHVYLYDRLSKTRVSRFNTKELHEQGIYKKEELLDVYKKIIQEKYHAENPIKITFKNARCVKCGKEIDIRFADKYPCHTEVIHKHPNMKLVHPGQLVPIDGREFERRFIDDNEDIFIGDRKFGHSYIDSIPIVNDIINYFKFRKQELVWTCCGELYIPIVEYIMSSGCSVRCTECDKGTATQGCMKVCKGCGRPWGESHGCSKEGQHEFNTFYSSHDEL